MKKGQGTRFTLQISRFTLFFTFHFSLFTLSSLDNSDFSPNFASEYKFVFIKSCKIYENIRENLR